MSPRVVRVPSAWCLFKVKGIRWHDMLACTCRRWRSEKLRQYDGIGHWGVLNCSWRLQQQACITVIHLTKQSSAPLCTQNSTAPSFPGLSSRVSSSPWALQSHPSPPSSWVSHPNLRAFKLADQFKSGLQESWAGLHQAQGAHHFLWRPAASGWATQLC